MFVSLPETERTVDRGDPAANDWTKATLAIDNAWHDLDLSGILPRAAAGKFVMFRLVINNTVLGEEVYIREKGNAQFFNTLYARSAVTAERLIYDALVKCDADRQVEYLVTDTGVWNMCNILIRGWYEG